MAEQKIVSTSNGMWNRHILDITERMYKVSFEVVWKKLLLLPQEQRPDSNYVRAYLQRNYPQQ